MTLNWAIHRLNGISSPANAAYNADELAYQIENAGCSAIFACLPLLETSLKAAKKAGIPKEKVYICELPDITTGGAKLPAGHKTLCDLINAGKNLPELEPIKWEKGQGAKQTAFLCYSSGTSGLPACILSRNCKQKLTSRRKG